MRDAVEEAFRENEYQKMKWLNQRPKCQVCGEPIQDERYYSTEDYEVVCEDCLEDLFEKWKKDSYNYTVID